VGTSATTAATEVAPEAGTVTVETPSPEEVRTLIEATDLHNRFRAIAQFAQSLLEEGREPIVEALAARRMDRTRLTDLARDAAALADALGGKVVRTASEWTALEADAAKAQKEKWDACRRMLRAVVRAHPDKLNQLWTHC